MLNRTSQHALNVLRRLARDPGQRVPTDVLARETGVPASYLSKILNELSKHAVVEGEKGWRGGFRVRPEALERSLQSITEIFDKPGRATAETCIFGLDRCDSANPCALHAYWEHVRATREEMLASHTVQDLLHGKRGGPAR